MRYAVIHKILYIFYNKLTKSAYFVCGKIFAFAQNIICIHPRFCRDSLSGRRIVRAIRR